MFDIRRYRKAILPLIPAIAVILAYIIPDADITEENLTAWYEQFEVWVGIGIALSGPIISYIVPNDGTT